jgi:hypothetical protein
MLSLTKEQFEVLTGKRSLVARASVFYVSKFPTFSNVFDIFQLKMAPEIQKPAPHFKGQAVVNGQFQDIDLTQYKGKYVVLFFYPLDL